MEGGREGEGKKGREREEKMDGSGEGRKDRWKGERKEGKKRENLTLLNELSRKE